MSNKFKLCIFICILSIALIGCANKNNEKAKEGGIYSYKTEFVGDNSKVIGIVNSQQYSEKVKVDGIKILSEKEPYGLNVYVIRDKKLVEDDLFKNAVVTFSLIDNLENLSYVDKNTDKVLLNFNRKNVEEKLKNSGEKSLKEIASSEKNINSYLGK